MKRKHIFYFLSFITLLTSCSDFDEQEFTVLLPNAGADQVVFTEVTGTSIQLDGSGSTDVNDIGFEYLWEIIDFPENTPATITNENIVSPVLEVPLDAAGRYQLQLTIFIGDQITQDVVNIDVNPANAQVLFVNAIDSVNTALFTVPAVDIIGNAVSARDTSEIYYNIDTNISDNDDGTTLLQVEYNGDILTINETLEALKSYTLYLAGSEENPQLFFIEKVFNQNTITNGNIGLDAINLNENNANIVLFIDATFAGFGEVPLDNLFIGFLGLEQGFGLLNFPSVSNEILSNDILFPSESIIPLPIWATINGERISNNVVINLPASVDSNFGTFMLFPDASSVTGNTLIFVNNSELLPL